MSKIAQDIILRPIITEESMLGTADKKYTFSVAKDANKIEIAKAVEELFKVLYLPRQEAPLRPFRGIHFLVEKGYSDPYGELQDHRVLRRHDVIINQ